MDLLVKRELAIAPGYRTLFTTPSGISFEPIMCEHVSSNGDLHIPALQGTLIVLLPNHKEKSLTFNAFDHISKIVTTCTRSEWVQLMTCI